MANPKTKQELLTSINDGYAKLNEQIAKMSEAEMAADFDFAADSKKCGVRWQSDKCLRDLLIHTHRPSNCLELTREAYDGLERSAAS